MSPEEILFISRIEKAISNGHFPLDGEGEWANVLVAHQKECTLFENDMNDSGCNCIPDLIVSFNGQTFSIDPEGIVSNHVIN